MRLAPVFALSLVSSVAAAEPATHEDPKVAAAINFPAWWSGAQSIAGSLYFGLTAHDALRFNVASYKSHGSLAGDFAALAVGSDGDESLRSGRVLDLGAAWTNYSRRLWSGFTWELGGLVRIKDIRRVDEFATPEVLATDTQVFAGRAQIGWSWLIGNHVFVAAGFGLSAGYERGHETSDRSYDSMPMTAEVSRAVVSGEGFLRFGLGN